jgi:hypothetical protein
MERDARILQLLLYLADGALAAFEPAALPKSVTDFLDSADQRQLNTLLIELLHRLDWPGKSADPDDGIKPGP